MNIVYALPHFPPKHIGGTERVVERLAHSMQARGHSVDVICVEKVNNENGRLECEDQEVNGFRVHRLSLPVVPQNKRILWEYRNPLIGEWFSHFLNSRRTDVVHLHSGYLISAIIAEKAMEKNIPTVISLHDFWFACPIINLLKPNGYLCAKPSPCAGCYWCLLSEKRRYRIPDIRSQGKLGELFIRVAQNQAVSRLLRLREPVRQLNERRQYLRDVVATVDAVTAPSKFLIQKYLDYQVTSKNMVLLQNGFDRRPRNNELKLPSKHTPLRIGYLGQIAQHKGVHVLVDAFISTQAGLDTIELFLYGSETTWPEYAVELRKKTLGRANIYFKGAYQAAEIGDVMDELDVIVVPSICFENRPTVILEAFSYLKPVIVSDLGGMAEMVDHDGNGLKFKPGDVDSLSMQLRRFLDEPGLLPHLRAGIRPVKTVEEETLEVEHLYEQAISRREWTGDLFPN